MTRTSVSRLIFFRIALLLGIYSFLELSAHLAMWKLSADPRFNFTTIRDRQQEMRVKLREMIDAQDTALLQLDEELGWVYGPNYRGELYSSNSRGLRGQREYSQQRSDGVLRVAAFGDSFVHGNEVHDEDSWSVHLERIDSHIEVLNYGVGGYGTDQALIYYERAGKELDPQIVFLGFAEVDYARNLNRFRRFLSVHELPLFKPRFVIPESNQESLDLIPNAFPGAEALEVLIDKPEAVRRSAERDWFYQPLVWSNPLYDHVGFVRLSSTLLSEAWRSRFRPDRLYRNRQLNKSSEAFELLVALIKRFETLAEERRHQFVLVIFPGRERDIWGNDDPTYQPLLDRLEDDTLVLDLANAFRNDPSIHPANLFRFRHYGARANATVAHAVHKLVTSKTWLRDR